MPVVKIAARRTVSHSLTIHEQDKAVVGADMDNDSVRTALQFEDFAKVKYARIANRGCRMSDPARGPLSIGLLRCCVRGEGYQSQKAEKDRSQQTRGRAFFGVACARPRGLHRYRVFHSLSRRRCFREASINRMWCRQ